MIRRSKDQVFFMCDECNFVWQYPAGSACPDCGSSKFHKMTNEEIKELNKDYNASIKKWNQGRDGKRRADYGVNVNTTTKKCPECGKDYLVATGMCTHCNKKVADAVPEKHDSVLILEAEDIDLTIEMINKNPLVREGKVEAKKGQGRCKGYDGFTFLFPLNSNQDDIKRIQNLILDVRARGFRDLYRNVDSRTNKVECFFCYNDKDGNNMNEKLGQFIAKKYSECNSSHQVIVDMMKTFNLQRPIAMEIFKELGGHYIKMSSPVLSKETEFSIDLDREQDETTSSDISITPTSGLKERYTKFKCEDCGKEWEPEQFPDVCPKCGSVTIEALE